MTASRARVVTGLSLAVVALLAGCGRLTAPAVPPVSSASSLAASPYPSSTASGSPPVPAPAPAGVNGASVDSVALAAVKAIEGSDTAFDADPNDTVRRAAAWLTASFAGQVRAFPPVAAPGAQWNGWAAHRAYVRVTTSPLSANLG